MGTFDLQLIHPAAVSDDAAPVGSTKQWLDGTARRVLVHSNGESVFGGEEPITVAHVWRRVGNVGRWRCEVKASPSDGPVHGEELVVSEFPRGNGWVFSVRFRRALQRGEEERPDVETLTWSEADALPHDPWEKGRRVTAAIVEPPGPEAPAGKVRLGTHTKWVFGVCKNANEHAARLVATSRASELLEYTHVMRPDTPKKADGQIQESAKTIPIADDVLPERNALLLLAIRQALAGPLEQGEDETQQSGDATDMWAGRPVMDLVTCIYTRHLTNRTKAVGRARQGESEARRQLAAMASIRTARQRPR